VSDFRRDGAAALDWVARYLEEVRDYPVLARVEPGQVRAELPASPPEEGEPFEDLLRDLDRVLVPGTTHWNHPRFFAYFGTSGSDPGILAEFIAAALNVNTMVWHTGPAATELEELVLDWMAQLLGLPEGWHGHIEDTASISTISALAAARELVPGGAVLASEQANFSVEKAARLLGLEYRPLPVDEQFSLGADAVAAELDRGGVTAVVPTVGTTGTTAVDPVADIAELCAQHRVWLHVDAAYAGSAAVCEEFRWALDGVEGADSLVVNAHKWFFTPVDCSCFWTKRPDVLLQAFSASAPSSSGPSSAATGAPASSA
jgi:aromatic-L-amino-acid decarboxylase